MRPGLDSATMRKVLACVQRAQLEGKPVPTMAEIAQAAGTSASMVWRHLRALRKGRYVSFKDKAQRTIRVREWL